MVMTPCDNELYAGMKGQVELVPTTTPPPNNPACGLDMNWLSGQSLNLVARHNQDIGLYTRQLRIINVLLMGS